MNNNNENNYPLDMIETNGNKNYAYVTLLILNELFTSAAIVLAESLRKIGSLAELVIMIDESITLETQDLLKKFYDRIIIVELIEISSNNLLDNISKYILTKFRALNLTEYKKIILIDADSIILKYPDNPFVNNTPAVRFINNNIQPGYVILTPEHNINKKMKKIIKNLNTIKQIKPFDYTLKYLYGEKLNKLDSKIISYNEFNNSYGIQYTITKPFILQNSIPIEIRIEYEHFKLWFYHFRNILNKYPEIFQYKSLIDTINIGKYFLSTLSKFSINHNTNAKSDIFEQISKIYNIKKNKNLEYYHINISKEYDSHNIEYIIENITLNNFILYISEQIPLFIDLINISKIHDIIQKINLHITNLLWDKCLLDFFILQYTKYYSNVSIILSVDSENVIPISNNSIYLLKKTYTFNGHELKNILFNIYQNYVYDERIIFLSKYNDKQKYVVEFYVYQTLFPLNLISDNNNIFTFNDINSKVRIVSIFLNPNTLKKFISREIDFISNDKLKKNILIDLLNLQTLKKWLYNTYSGNQLDNIIIITCKSNIFSLNIIIIDNNNYNPVEIKKYLNEKIEFVEVIFAKSSSYKYKLKPYQKILNNIYNPNYYWEFEGLKYTI